MPNDFYFGVEYKTVSSFEELQPNKYLTDIDGKILMLDQKDSLREIVGKFRFFYVDIMLARRESYPLADLFQGDASLFEIGDVLIDFHRKDFKKGLYDSYGKSLLKKNLLVLDYIEIIESCRGLDLGKMTIKDIMTRFGHNCGVMAVEMYYPMLDEKIPHEPSAWENLLNKKPVNENSQRTLEKLNKFFKGLGFDNDQDERIFTLCLGKKNPIDTFEYKPI